VSEVDLVAEGWVGGPLGKSKKTVIKHVIIYSPEAARLRAARKRKMA
jgi:hypothetical protein